MTMFVKLLCLYIYRSCLCYRLVKTFVVVVVVVVCLFVCFFVLFSFFLLFVYVIVIWMVHCSLCMCLMNKESYRFHHR